MDKTKGSTDTVIESDKPRLPGLVVIEEAFNFNDYVCRIGRSGCGKAVIDHEMRCEFLKKLNPKRMGN